MRISKEQTTISRPVSKHGIGLHSGERCVLTLLPSTSNVGIIFVSNTGVEIPATAEYVVDTTRGTSIGAGTARVGGVEHLLAALYTAGIDNVRIEVEGPETPACDGSAAEWVALLRQAGKSKLGTIRQVVKLQQAMWAGDSEAWAVALPANEFRLAVGVDFAGMVIGRQTFSLRVNAARFKAEIASARTFALMEELEALRAAGLSKGGSLENSFAAGPTEYSGPLRFPDEVVRHKALDLLGDLALCGFPLQAHVLAIKPSHKTNVALAKALRATFLAQITTRFEGEERPG